MDLKTLTSTVMEIAEDKGIPQEKVLEIISEAIAAAYKKDYGKKKQKVIAQLDPKTGEAKFWQVKLVVDEKMILEEPIEKVKATKKETKKKQTKTKKPSSTETIENKEKIHFNPERHITLEEAKKIEPKIKVGEEIKFPLKAEEVYGRIAAQTAKQVILQKLKEAEREEILKEYQSKEGEAISGIVQRIEQNAIFLDIGRTSAILPKAEQVPNEFYRPGQRLKLYVLKIEMSPKGPIVFVSRSYPKLISKLFELEVPEISTGQVVIKSIAREAGSRTKIAVVSTEEGIDPIGSVVGQRGTRILAVINELGGEKIDVIVYSSDPQKYIANALSPAKVLEVKILPQNKASAIVPDNQLSLAIGKDGQNVRLAAKLTTWRIDVKSEKESLTENQ